MRKSLALIPLLLFAFAGAARADAPLAVTSLRFTPLSSNPIVGTKAGLWFKNDNTLHLRLTDGSDVDLTANAGGGSNATSIRGVSVVADAPTTAGQIFVYLGGQYINTYDGAPIIPITSTFSSDSSQIALNMGGSGGLGITPTIKDGAVGHDQLASGAALGNITDGSLPAAKLAPGAALTNIGSGGMDGSTYLENNTVTGDKLQDASVDLNGSKITNGLGIAHGGTGLSSAGGTANRVMVTTNGTSFSVAQLIGSMINPASTYGFVVAPGGAASGSVSVSGIGASDSLQFAVPVSGAFPMTTCTFASSGSANTVTQSTMGDCSGTNFLFYWVKQ